jgi:ferredoxin--NADP+ reductase
MTGWNGGPAGTGRKLRVRFWLRPTEIQESDSRTVAGLRLERTRLSESGVFEGTGEFETLDTQMVLRSVGYQSVPLPGVPFDSRTHTVPNVGGRVLSESGEPLPGEYVAGWLKRGPTGVIGTNKADAAETVQALLADLAGGPDLGEGKLPRPGLLRRPDGEDRPEPEDTVSGSTDGKAGARSELASVLATRGVAPVSYADWLRISAAEEDLAASLGRGDRVKLHSRDAIWTAARRNPR